MQDETILRRSRNKGREPGNSGIKKKAFSTWKNVTAGFCRKKGEGGGGGSEGTSQSKFRAREVKENITLEQILLILVVLVRTW